MLATASPWAVLAYPLLWCAADTLLAHLHPDGNWSSLAYSQAGFAPALQIVSLLGVAGLVFVLSLFPAALALAALRGWPAARWPLAASVLLALGCLGFGYARIPAAALVQGDAGRAGRTPGAAAGEDRGALAGAGGAAAAADGGAGRAHARVAGARGRH
jgi:apolipoprotein N-acyltransferase